MTKLGLLAAAGWGPDGREEQRWEAEKRLVQPWAGVGDSRPALVSALVLSREPGWVGLPVGQEQGCSQNGDPRGEFQSGMGVPLGHLEHEGSLGGAEEPEAWREGCRVHMPPPREHVRTLRQGLGEPQYLEAEQRQRGLGPGEELTEGGCTSGRCTVSDVRTDGRVGFSDKGMLAARSKQPPVLFLCESNRGPLC